jgi:hypothetical protein
MRCSSGIDAHRIHATLTLVRTTVDLPEGLLKNAKRHAARRGVTLSVVVEDALRSQLTAKKTAPPPPFKLYTVRGKLVAPDLDLDRTSELIAQDDESEFGPAARP